MGKFKTVYGTFQDQGLCGVVRTIAEHTVPVTAISKFYNIKYRTQYGRFAPMANEIILVDPQDINKSIHWEAKSETVGSLWNYQTALQRDYSFVLDGDWDSRANYFDEIKNKKYVIIHISVNKHFLDDIPWEETDIHRLETEFTGDDRYLNIDERVEYLDSLYESISEDGYKSQSELGNDEKKSGYVDEITVAISKHGEVYWLVNGFHRLQLARVVESIESIPVRVGLRHKKWQKIRCEIAAANSVDEINGSMHKYLDHPDIKGISP